MSEMECPLCGASTTEAFVVGDRNRGIGTERFAYRRCVDCGGYHVANPPTDLGHYYPEEYYLLPDVRQLDLCAMAERPKLELLRPFTTDGSLVDVGAGLGLFARAAANAGYDVTAIEMDARCCTYLERVVGVRTIQSERPDEALAALEPVRAITLWHVLEHLPNPWTVLEAAAKRLEPGGVLLVATPNPEFASVPGTADAVGPHRCTAAPLPDPLRHPPAASRSSSVCHPPPSRRAMRRADTGTDSAGTTPSGADPSQVPTTVAGQGAVNRTIAARGADLDRCLRRSSTGA